ncbi:MAG: hypothetical protein HYZ75_10440 [Elusimicrobia bacterium]|nr:hypothetical protein [Elusimicrobiota bacterium]
MLDLGAILRTSVRFSLANVAGGALSSAAYILAARRLGPVGFGVVGFVQLWLLYASFLKPGILQAGYREMLHELGRDDAPRAMRIEGVALVGEAAFLTVPLALFMAGAVLQTDPLLRTALLFGAASFLANALYQGVDTIQWAYRRFTLTARVNMLVKLGQPLLLLTGLYAFGLWGVLAAPMVTALGALAYYLLRTKGLHYTFAWDVRELRGLLAVGLPFSLYGALYWAFRTADRSLVAAALPLAALGAYSFAMTFITQACQLVSDFLNVLQAELFTSLGKTGSVRPLASRVTTLQLLILCGTGAAAGLAQAAVPFASHTLVPAFAEASGAYEVMCLLVASTSASLLATTLLLSKVVNGQKPLSAVQAGALVLFGALGTLTVSSGGGLGAIAWCAIAAQAAAAAAAWRLLHGHLFEGAPAGEAAVFYGRMAGLAACAVAVHFLLRHPWLADISLPEAALRAAVAAAAWTMAGLTLVRPAWRASAADDGMV